MQAKRKNTAICPASSAFRAPEVHISQSGPHFSRSESYIAFFREGEGAIGLVSAYRRTSGGDMQRFGPWPHDIYKTMLWTRILEITGPRTCELRGYTDPTVTGGVTRSLMFVMFILPPWVCPSLAMTESQPTKASGQESLPRIRCQVPCLCRWTKQRLSVLCFRALCLSQSC